MQDQLYALLQNTSTDPADCYKINGRSTLYFKIQNSESGSISGSSDFEKVWCTYICKNAKSSA